MGHAEDEAVKEALAELTNSTRHLEILGSYPRAEHVPLPESQAAEE